MLELVKSLQQEEIVYSQNVIDLRKAIDAKYPHYTPQAKAQLFAKAIYKIIDKNISQFDSKTQLTIKSTLLQQALIKKSFEINAYDIFEVWHDLKLEDEASLQTVSNWINHVQKRPFSQSHIKTFVTHFKQSQQTRRNTLNKSKSLNQPFAASTVVPKSSTPKEDLLHANPIPDSSDGKAPSMKIKDRVPVKTKAPILKQSNVIEIESAPKATPPTLVATPAPSTSKNTTPVREMPSPISLASCTHKIDHSTKRKKGMAIVASCIALVAIGCVYRLNPTVGGSKEVTALNAEPPLVPSETLDTLSDLLDNGLQSHLQYKEIDEKALADWLTMRGSILAEEPYFTSMLDVAYEFNINPLLMFAITGQEQGFVPKDHPEAEHIANNPFNVFGSWQDFNTTIEDTSAIAARTIINLSAGCPEDEDPIKWLNQKYAEDQNWHLGVSSIFYNLESIAGSPADASPTSDALEY